ncbi:MAG: response regulator transcription factor [Bacteroidales bacterium]|nr:response regulator transcription factor [Bacteroidales bacterium]
MRINCIVVDDEPASRDILEKYISDCPAINLICCCRNAMEASGILNKEDIQLIFLDINMPKISGLKFYKSLTNPPYVIFTTAYPEYAVEGFEVDAIDYLLKPFPFERFLKAVNKALDKFNSIKQETRQNAFILFKSDKKLYRVVLDEINYLEALGDYVRIYYQDKSILVHETFQNIFGQLPEKEFVRVHKSFAIAFNKLEVIEGNMIKIKGKSIPIGQTYRAEFLNLVKSRG